MRTSKLGETRRSTDPDVMWMCLVRSRGSCRSRIKLCFAILYYPILSWQSKPHAVPRGLCITHNVATRRMSKTERSIICFQAYSSPNANKPKPPAQTIPATTTCNKKGALHPERPCNRAAYNRVLMPFVIRSFFLPSLLASRQNAHPPILFIPVQSNALHCHAKHKSQVKYIARRYRRCIRAKAPVSIKSIKKRLP